MRSTTLILSSTETNFNTNLSPPIQLDPNKEFEAALLSINLYNSIPNITETNNKFKYSIDDQHTWKIISLNKGSYELQAINDEIQRQMIGNGDYDTANNEPYITISANVSELKSIIHIANKSYSIDFSIANSVGSILGFKPEIISYGYNKSHDIVDITKVNSVLVNTDIISGSYVNGIESSAIYSFDPYKVSPGYKIDERPNPSLIYYPVNRKDIYSIRMWLTDQDSNPIDLRSERVTIKLQIREVKNTKQQIINAVKELKEKGVL